MAEKVGVFNRLFLSTADTDDVYAEVEFLEGSAVGVQEVFTDPNGLRGSRQHRAERVRRTQRQVTGRLQFAPSPTELDLLLPWLAGGDKSTNTIPFAETLKKKYLIATRDGTHDKYTDVKVNQATFSCAEGSPLQVALDVIGVDETLGVSLPADGDLTTLAESTELPCYVMSDCALTVGGTTYQFRQLQVTVANQLETRFNNSLTPTSIHATDLQVQVQLSLPLGDASALYGSAVTGVQVVATFTNGGTSFAITMNGVSAPKQTKDYGTRQALNLPWVGTARKNGTGDAIAFTNDSTT